MPVATTSVVGENVSFSGTYDVSATFFNVPDGCGYVQGAHNPPNRTSLGVGVMSDSPIGPGVYKPTSTSLGAFAVFAAYGAQCETLAETGAQSVTVTLTTVTDSEVDGSFDAVFAVGGHVTGTFSAPVCNPPAAFVPLPRCGT
jgi:hypothetical protein